MFSLKSLCIALLVLILNGCATIPSPNIAVSDFAIQNQSELITLEAGDQIVAFTARIENDGNTIQIVAITPTGQRLFSFEKRGEQLISEAGPLWPKAMPLAAVWADIEMAHAKPNAPLAKNWRQERGADVTLWTYRGQIQASVKQEIGRIILTKPSYQLTLEVLEE